MKFEKHIDIEGEGKTAVEILSEKTDLTKQHIKQVMNKGAVWLTQQNKTKRVRRADKQLKKNDQLHLYYDDKVLTERVPAASVIADEGDFSVLYKPYGMLSQGSKWGDHCTIHRWAEQALRPQRPAIIVHRLDRATSGLILIAHKKRVAGLFTRLFEQRQMTKKYQAIVHGKFPAEMTMQSSLDEQKALTQARLIDYDSHSDRSLLEVCIDTGRKHQIRRHLAEAGFAIVGDRLYGSAKENDENLKLVSYFLSFVSPVDQQAKQYKLPRDLQLSLKAPS